MGLRRLRGRTTPEIRETDPEWTIWTHPSPNGETPEQEQARADALLADASVALGEGDVGLAGHGHFSQVLIARWVGLPATEGVQTAMDAARGGIVGPTGGCRMVSGVPAAA